MNRAEMNDEMMAQVNGGYMFEEIINFDPIDYFFPETLEEKKARRETRDNIVKKIIDIVL